MQQKYNLLHSNGNKKRHFEVKELHQSGRAPPHKIKGSCNCRSNLEDNLLFRNSTGGSTKRFEEIYKSKISFLKKSK